MNIKRTNYFIYVVVVGLAFVLLYYACYYYARVHMKADNIITKEEAMEANPSYHDGLEDSTVSGQVDEPIVKRDMNYVEECYDIDTGELDRESLAVPIALLGLNREEVLDYYSKYMKNNDEKDVVNIQLVSFSDTGIVVRKSVRKTAPEYHYFVTIKNQKVQVYLADRKTLYIDTGIEADTLPIAVRKELRDGYSLETVRELYNFLENISS